MLLRAGWATGSALVTGTKRDPIDPSQVAIYRSAPDTKFEYIGIVKSEAAEIFSQQEALDRAVDELKKQAAKVGAIQPQTNTKLSKVMQSMLRKSRVK